MRFSRNSKEEYFRSPLLDYWDARSHMEKQLIEHKQIIIDSGYYCWVTKGHDKYKLEPKYYKIKGAYTKIYDLKNPYTITLKIVKDKKY